MLGRLGVRVATIFLGGTSKNSTGAPRANQIHVSRHLQRGGTRWDSQAFSISTGVSRQSVPRVIRSRHSRESFPSRVSAPRSRQWSGRRPRRGRAMPAKAALVKPLFERFNQHLDAKGYIARGGQIVVPPSSSRPSSTTHGKRTKRSKRAR